MAEDDGIRLAHFKVAVAELLEAYLTPPLGSLPHLCAVLAASDERFPDHFLHTVGLRISRSNTDKEVKKIMKTLRNRAIEKMKTKPKDEENTLQLAVTTDEIEENRRNMMVRHEKFEVEYRALSQTRNEETKERRRLRKALATEKNFDNRHK